MSIILYPGYSQKIVRDNLIVKTIASITQNNPATLTTSDNHNYVAGMNVSFLIPKAFGMQELNKLVVQVLTASTNILTLNIDTTQFSPFAYPSPLPTAYTPPSIIPYSSGPFLPPQPLPFGNQNSFEGVIYNAGQP